MESQQVDNRRHATDQQEYHLPTEREDYAARMGEILNQPLRPDTIEHYGDQALTQLIDLVAEMTDDYDKSPTLQFDEVKRHEDATLAYFNLGTIERTLDHVAGVADSIARLDTLISEVTVSRPAVIVPTDKRPLELSGGRGERQYVPAQRIARLKTLLFLLEQDFAINLDEEGAVQIYNGIVEKDMLRKTSYHSVVVPELRRAIFINDEEANATFIYDSDKLASEGYTIDIISSMTKSQQGDLMQAVPGIGRRIVYSDQFTEDIKQSLSVELNGSATNQEVAQPTSYLHPKPPEGYLPRTRLVEKFNATHKKLDTVVLLLADSLGEIGQYRYRSLVGPGFSPEQQALIREEIERDRAQREERKAEKQREYDGIIDAPEGYLNRNDICAQLDIDMPTLYRTLTTLDDTIGEVSRYRFPFPMLGHSPEQQKAIAHYITESRKIPEGYVAIAEFAQSLDITKSQLLFALRSLTEDLGELQLYLHTKGTPIIYSPQQQELIRRHIENGARPAPVAPEGYLAIAGIARSLGMTFNAVSSAVKQAKSQLGNTITYQFGQRVTVGYSPQQQEVIIEQLRAASNLHELVSNGYLSRVQLCEQWGVNRASIDNAVRKLGDNLGAVGCYKGEGDLRSKSYFSPDQQQQIYTELRRVGSLIPRALEG